YGSFVYCPLRSNAMDRIQKIQNAALRIILGCRISTPVGVLHAEAKLVLIKERMRYLCFCFLAKILSNTGSLTYTNIIKHSDFLNRIKPNSGVKTRRLISECIVAIMHYRPNIVSHQRYGAYRIDYRANCAPLPVDLDSGKALKWAASCNLNTDSIVNNFSSPSFYTDGSKVKENCHIGYAVVCPMLEYEKQVSCINFMSVYTAECAAIHDALVYIVNNQLTKAFIFSDSLSALQSLNAYNMKSEVNPFIVDIRSLYFKYITSNPNAEIKFCWIPTHRGIEGNELADIMAKQATLSINTDINCVPFSDLRAFFKTDMYKRSTSMIWSMGQYKGVYYFSNHFQDSRKPWYERFNLPRALTTTIIRIRSNHYNLNASLHRVNIVGDASCRCGFPNEDIDHILWNCRCYNDSRENLIKDLKKLDLHPPFSTVNLVTTPNIPACALILSSYVSMYNSYINK
ncbi:uncharacterized protein, partial [Prorops nasuta]|uniref:uncharacterized protein n=1 Tax=Prorops nasuta TaxID=863751 RepID=UPI0034CE247E